MKLATSLLLATGLAAASALAQPDKPGEPSANAGASVDTGDQAAGRATPSRDVSPQPGGSGTPPINTGADAGATKSNEQEKAASDKHPDSTIDVKPNAGGVAAKPPPSEVNAADSTIDRPSDKPKQ